MDYQEFVAKVEGAKHTQTHTGYVEDLKLYSSADRTTYTQVRKHLCRCCGHDDEKRQTIRFKRGQTLSVFENDLLWLVFAEGRRPADYGQYHKCVAGKRFIENIENIA